MTIDEKRKKLQTIKICVTNLVLTYDMGLQFDVMDGEGVTTNFGNVVQWPCFKIGMDEKTRKVVGDLMAGREVTNEEMMETSFCQNFTSYTDYIHGEGRFDDAKTVKILNIIREELKGLKSVGDILYAYVMPEDWNMDFKFFATEAELEDFFLEYYGGHAYSYAEMSDEEIEQYYENAEDEGWGGMPYHTIGIEEDSEE